MRHLLAVIRLVRLESSLLGFLSVFVPTWARSHDLRVSMGRALPLLFICMCAYIANDVYDMENDRVNHPYRPLPTRQLNLVFVAILYFTCLTAALFTTRRFVDEHSAFWYYGLATLAISYGYVLDCARFAKAPYVAAVTAMPIMIVAFSYHDSALRTVALAAFVASLGREMCKDILDRKGDPVSFPSRIPARMLAATAFAAQMGGVVALAFQVHQLSDVIVLFAMASLLAVAAVHWFNAANYRYSVAAMRVMFGLGVYFLA